MKEKCKQQLILELAERIWLEECKSDDSYMAKRTQLSQAKYSIELAQSFYEVAIDLGLISFWPAGNFKQYGKNLELDGDE